ncbi:MAG: hypothetical protein L7U48_05055 [Candidatus Poseidoniaceae archaeon]|nr:hypothetical protein [Candidatus Poseidoniaceae archaeon]
MTVGEAHIGGHVTLLFSIHDDELLPRRQGSRGAGLCLDAGVRVRAEALPAAIVEDSAGAIPAPRPARSNGSIEVEVSDRFGRPWPEGEAMYITLINDLRAVRRLSPSTSWRLDVRLELPISQGFGMSAAGFLAAALAVLEANGTPDPRYAARAAHRLERQHRGGLGDVLALQAGGMALRREPGAPGVVGQAEGASLAAPLLLVWQPDESRHTSAYIDHPGWKRSITEAGEAALQPLLAGAWTPKRWDDLLEAAAVFANRSGLEEEHERATLLQSVQTVLVDHGLASAWTCRLCMLGVSAVVMPRRPEDASSLELDALRGPLESAGFHATMCGLSPPPSDEEE